MKKNSFTLIEFVIAMTLGTILMLALSYQFIAITRFGNVLKNKAEPSREAYIVMDHMTHVLRFAKVSQAISYTSNANEERLTATIEGGHISLVPADAVYYYQRDKTTNPNYLYFSSSPTPNSGVVLSQYCTSFIASRPVQNELILQITFTKGGSSTTNKTTIRVLGS